MSENWPRVRLGELLRRVKDEIDVEDEQTYARLTIRMNGNGIVLRDRAPGHEIGTKKQFLARVGQLVLSKIDARNGAFGILSSQCDKAIITGNFWAFDADKERLLPSYFNYLTKTPLFVEFCVRASEGTTNRLYLQEDQFLAQEIMLPPLAEQRRIVARIEDIEEKVQLASQLRREAQVETDALFAKSISNAFEQHKANMQQIGDTFRVTTGGTPSRTNPASWDGDILWVSSGEVNFRTIEDTAEKITRDGVENSNAKINPPGTVLMAMIGQGKTRGQCAILNCHAATNQNVAAIHVYETAHLPEYVYWWLVSQYRESRLSEIGTAQPALSAERVKRIQIPLPAPPEQKKTVEYLMVLQSQSTKLRAAQSEACAELDALMPSILDKAFRGEL